MDVKIIKRFLSKVDKTEHQRCKDHGCWMWTASLKGNGYGSFSVTHGRSVLAHRLSYEHFKGEIPKGMVVRHRCPYSDGDRENRLCVNPDHLEVGTQKQNIGEGYNNHRAKTHCPKCGGDYTLRKDGAGRFCRPCETARTREYRRKLRARV
jgi:hypothetical protein